MQPLIEYKEFKSSRSFGIEFEVDGEDFSREDLSNIISKSTHKRVKTASGWAESKGNSYWHVKYDSTCGKNDHFGKPTVGWEVASFKGRGHPDLLHISNVAQALKSAGVGVNYNCGLHIHVDVKDYSEARVSSILANWVKIEDVFYNMVPKRRRNCGHCNPWKTHRLREDLPPKLSVFKNACSLNSDRYNPNFFWETMKPTNTGAHRNPDKKLSLNFINYIRSNKNRKTLELRIPEGTLNGWESRNWAIVFIHFVENARCFPDNIEDVKNINDFFDILGIAGKKNFYILGQDLNSVRSWILTRLQRFSDDATLWKSAWKEWKNINILNNSRLEN